MCNSVIYIHIYIYAVTHGYHEKKITYELANCATTPFFFFFFWIGKSNELIKKEGPQAAREYTGSMAKAENKTRTKREDKENPPAHNMSMINLSKLHYEFSCFTSTYNYISKFLLI